MDPAVPIGIRNRSARAQIHQSDSSKRLVRCCLVGTTTSSLALRATEGGCGLDPRRADQTLASKLRRPNVPTSSATSHEGEKLLAFRVAIRERKNGSAGAEPKNATKPEDNMT